MSDFRVCAIVYVQQEKITFSANPIISDRAAFFLFHM